MRFYKLIHKRIVLYTTSIIVLTNVITAYARDKDSKTIPNIIIITLSGVRNDDSIGDSSHQFMPHLWFDMLKEGVLYNNVTDPNCEFHMPAVDSINTGEDYPLFFNRPQTKAPSFFQYIRKKYSLPAYKLWSIGHWFYNGCIYRSDEYDENTFPCEIAVANFPGAPRFIVLSPELEQILTKQELVFVETFNKGDKSRAFVHHWDSIDEIIFGMFNKIIKEYSPVCIHYTMAAVETAHFDTYGRYLHALKRCDEKIFKIWRLIQNHPFYKDNTFLIVTPDHQRNLYYMQHDEHAYGNPSVVWMYIYGPGVKKGKLISRQVSHADIFATVAYLLDLKTHDIEGKPLKDGLR